MELLVCNSTLYLLGLRVLIRQIVEDDGSTKIDGETGITVNPAGRQSPPLTLSHPRNL